MIEIIKEIRDGSDDPSIKCLDMRIGIHTGKVVAGIIGSKVVRYDIFGEGVLIANQVNQYVDQIQEFGHASLQKLYLVSGAQGVDTVAPVTPAAEA